MPYVSRYKFVKLDVLTTLNTYHDPNYIEYKTDIFQKLLMDCTLNDPYICWLLLLLILNYKRWKRPVICLIIVFWILRFLNQVSVLIITEIEPIKGKTFPYDVSNYGKLMFAYITLMAFQIVGDWYPLLRTKAVVHKKRDLVLIYTTCIIYNIGKLLGIFVFLIYKPDDLTSPFSDPGMPKRDQMPKQDPNKKDIITIFGMFFITIEFAFVAGFIYDLSIIYVLRKNVFKKAKDKFGEKQSFIEKFKKMSEYRIVFSIIITFIAIPAVGLYIFLNFQSQKDGQPMDMTNTSFVTYFELAISFNYFIMFVDQILLRYYAEENNPSYRNYTSSNTNSSLQKGTFGNDINSDIVNQNYNNIFSQKSTNLISYDNNNNIFSQKNKSINTYDINKEIISYDIKDNVNSKKGDYFQNENTYSIKDSYKRNEYNSDNKESYYQNNYSNKENYYQSENKYNNNNNNGGKFNPSNFYNYGRKDIYSSSDNYDLSNKVNYNQSSPSNSYRGIFNASDFYNLNNKRESYSPSNMSYSPNPLLSHNSRNSEYCDSESSLPPPVPPIPKQYRVMM